MAEAAIVAVSASGVDGFALKLSVVPLAIWATLVVAVARGVRAAWLLLSGYTAFAAATFAIVFGGRMDELAPTLILLLLFAQVGLLVYMGRRTRIAP